MLNKSALFLTGILTVIFLLNCSKKSTETEPVENVKKDWESLDLNRVQDTLNIGSLNMYIGFDVEGLFIKDLSKEQVVYNESVKLLIDFLASRSDMRIIKMAETILKHNIDIVGLQEVTTLSSAGELLIDFPEYLLQALDSISNASLYNIYRQPLNNIPFVAVDSVSGEKIDLQFIEGNAILYKKSFEVIDSQKVLYKSGLPEVALLDEKIKIERGFLYLTLSNSKEGVIRKFQIYTTHLEIFSFIGKPQSEEQLIVIDDNYDSSMIQFVTGDLNALPGTGADTAFKVAGFIDTYGVWGEADKGLTCCLLDGPLIRHKDSTSEYSRRVDYVYGRNIVEVISSEVLLSEWYSLGSDSVYHASDHGFVTSKIVVQY